MPGYGSPNTNRKSLKTISAIRKESKTYNLLIFLRDSVKKLIPKDMKRLDIKCFNAELNSECSPLHCQSKSTGLKTN